MAKLRIEENSIRTELRMNRKNLAQLEAEMKRVSDNLLGVRRELAEHLEGSALTSAAAELARLAENDRKLEQAEAEIRKARRTAEEAKARINDLNDERSRLNAGKIRLEADISGLLSQKQEKETRLHELTRGVDIEEGYGRQTMNWTDWHRQTSNFRSGSGSLRSSIMNSM